MGDGTPADCVNGTQQKCTKITFCAGKGNANYVYRIKCQPVNELFSIDEGYITINCICKDIYCYIRVCSIRDNIDRLTRWFHTNTRTRSHTTLKKIHEHEYEEVMHEQLHHYNASKNKTRLPGRAHQPF